VDAVLIGVVIEGLDVLLRVLKDLPARKSGTLKAGRRKNEESEEEGGGGMGLPNNQDDYSGVVGGGRGRGRDGRGVLP
jgi:hypothetical protein